MNRHNQKETKTMSVFDKDTFLAQQTTGSNETKFTPVPMSEYKNNYIDDIDFDTWKNDKGADQPVVIFHVAITDEAVKKELGLDKPVVQDRVFVDVEADGSLSMGKNKNIRIGQYREACGQNDAKKPWNFMMLKGAGPFTVKVGHRFNKTTGEGPFAQIDRVTKG